MTSAQPHVPDPHDEAAASAQAAGVTVDSVATLDELDELRATVRAIWGDEVVPPRNLLRGLALGGACLLLARRAGEAAGFALGWLGWHGGVHLHSHEVGVVAGRRGSGIGLALKLAQRAHALDHGVTEARWTFDPLLRANATFNLVRLGAEVTTFHPNCYGDRTDAFNTGDTTDRVEVRWRLDRPPGRPLVRPEPGDTVIEVPDDYRRLQRDDPATAAAWRARVGQGLADVLARGEVVVGLGERGYVARRAGGS